MRTILNIFAISLLVFTAVQNNNAVKSLPMLEATDDSMVTVALFDKLNWIITDMQKLGNQFSDLNKRQRNHRLSISNLVNFKTELRELWQQQEIKTEKLLKQMQQEVFKNFAMQESLLKKNAAEMEILKSNDIVSYKRNRNWQTILRRQDGSENFNRTWNEYKTGFGVVNGEFFIGLEALHAMTTYADPQELLIILRDFDNQTRYAKYSDFLIGSESEKFKIKKIGKYQGDANDSFSSHLYNKFSTYDQDNDNTSTSNCADMYRGGWWFSSCYNSHLTGPFLHKPKHNTEKEKGIVWSLWHGLDYSLQYAEMLIRPK